MTKSAITKSMMQEKALNVKSCLQIAIDHPENSDSKFLIQAAMKDMLDLVDMIDQVQDVPDDFAELDGVFDSSNPILQDFVWK